jgi:hypothetical protein
MSEIEIYDIETATWHSQIASGVPNDEASVPGIRQDGCSVIVPSPDNSSYGIHITLGQGEPAGSYYDDVWVLLVPSFTWVKLFESITNSPRKFD